MSQQPKTKISWSDVGFGCIIGICAESYHMGNLLAWAILVCFVIDSIRRWART